MSKLCNLVLWIILAIFLIPFFYFGIGRSTTDPSTQYGVTWSRTHAQYLGTDPNEGLRALLFEANIKKYRIPAYWTVIEPTKGQYEWHDLSRDLDRIHEQGGEAILVIGAKQPRWPECWYPGWTKTLSKEKRGNHQIQYVKAVIKKYQNHPTITAWQVENEPTFFSSFGDCALYDPSLLLEETSIAKASGKPVYTTASGELSTWLLPSKNLDALGVSVYRVVTSPLFGLTRYWFVPPWFYQRKARLLRWWIPPIFVSEFQMEPWANNSLRTMSDKEQFRLFDLNQMQKNFSYARALHVPFVYFWGAEWWLWMRQKGHPEFLEEAKRFFVSTH